MAAVDEVEVPREGSCSGHLDPKVWKVIAVVLLGPFMTQMDSTVVNVSLSTIRQDLDASIAAAQWIISGYLLALALMLPLNGWLVDKLGAKRLYLVCFSAFTLTSVLCGAARTMDKLICARVLQGMAGAFAAGHRLDLYSPKPKEEVSHLRQSKGHGRCTAGQRPR
jgi:predicted MFS family arabinose efflux permease